MTTISDLNRRFTIQYQTKVADGYGSYTISYADHVTVWGKMTTHRSDEAVQAMKQTGRAVHNIRLRYRQGITAAMRIKYGQRYFAIIGPPIEVDQGGGRHWMDITVEEAS